jgi:hypothetical protein
MRPFLLLKTSVYLHREKIHALRANIHAAFRAS